MSCIEFQRPYLSACSSLAAPVAGPERWKLQVDVLGVWSGIVCGVPAASRNRMIGRNSAPQSPRPSRKYQQEFYNYNKKCQEYLFVEGRSDTKCETGRPTAADSQAPQNRIKREIAPTS